MSRRARFRERLEEAGLVHVAPRPLAVHLLGRDRYVPLTRLLLEVLDGGGVRGQTSTVTFYQLLAEPYRRGRDEDARRAGDRLEALRGLSAVPVSAALARQAARVRARLGGRTERAVQIATALEAGADLYVDLDSGLRRIAGMEVVDLEDYAGG